MRAAGKQSCWGRRSGPALVGLAFVVALVIVIGGCGGSSSTSSPSSQSTSVTSSSSAGGSTKAIKIALVEQLTANPFMQTMAAGSTDAAHSTPGVSLIDTGPPAPNPTTEISDLSQVLSQGVDGVSVDPSPASLFTKALKDASARTRVNLVNDGSVPGVPGGDALVAINNYQAARAMLDVVFSRLPANPSGTIVIGNCIAGNVTLDSRAAAYKAYITQKLPRVKVVGPFTTTTDPTGNLSNWERIYGSNPNALAYLGTCDSDGPSLVRVHQLHPGNYQTASFDINPAALQGIKSGAMTAAINEAPYVHGYLATALLIDAARAGKPVLKGFVNIKGELVTKSNIDAVIAREASPVTMRAGYASEIQAFLKGPATATGPIVLEPISNAYAK